MASNRQKYYSISRRCEDNIKRYIETWFRLEDFKRYNRSMIHVSTQDAYENIIHELSTFENRFYDDFDARNHRRSATKDDWKQFSIPNILNILDIIYRMRNYALTFDDELTNDDNSEPDEKPAEVELFTPKIGKIRRLCANIIWSEWSNERHWGPRVGVIVISIMEEGSEKVLLVSHINKNILNYGYPKGEPNGGETIRKGGFREFKEETGVDDLIDNLQINEDDGRIIKKYPHIGPIDRRRSRVHYYVITTTSTQFTGFQPKTNEILDVEWHSVYTIPCCDQCKIKRRYRFIKNADMPINYHMVTLRDINNKNSAILEILAYVDEKNRNRNAYTKYLHVHRNCEHDLL